MMTRTTAGAAEIAHDEEAFQWATTSLGEARREGRRRSAALLKAVVEDAAFALGAASFPPVGARAARVLDEQRSPEARHY